MTDRSSSHATFTIERTFAHPPARVFRAFADQASKATWFIAPSAWTNGPHTFDFRVGGRERLESIPPDGGPAVTFEATYFDIVPDERIIYGYDMRIGDDRISVSLAAIVLRPAPGGTHLSLTEHGIFLDGYDTVDERERGTRELIDALAAALDAERA